MPKMSDVAVCIIFLEKAEQTIECLKSVVPTLIPIYLLNNGSSPESSAAVADYARSIDRIKWLESPFNLGCAGGRNLLLSKSTEPWLFFLDNDATIRPADWLDRFLAHANREPTTEVFSARLFEAHGGGYRPSFRLRIQDETAYVEPGDSPATNIFAGGTSFVHRSVFERLGPFDDKLHGWEDWELAIRAELRGQPIRCRLMSDVEVFHDHRAATKDVDRCVVRVRYDFERIQASLERVSSKHRVAVGGRAAEWRTETQEQIDAILAGS